MPAPDATPNATPDATPNATPPAAAPPAAPSGPAGPRGPYAHPDSALARAADALLLAAAPPVLVGHSYRTYQFGRALLARHGVAVDPELAFVAAALHDLALTAAYADGHVPFEQRGAAVAYEALVAAGAGDATAARVRDAVALHLDVSSARDPRPEVAALHLGAVVDVVGLGLDRLPPAFVERVLAEYPRGETKRYLAEALAAEAERKPGSAAARLVREGGLLRPIAAAPFAS